MGKLRKIGKKIKRGFSKIGKKLKKGLGKIAKAFGKLGPLGSIALATLLPGMGSVLSGWLSNMGPVGEFILNIGSKIQKGANWVKDGVGRVFNRVTDAIEYGMNKVSGAFGGTGTTGSNFRNWVSEQTKGFIDPSTQGVEDITVPGSTKTITGPDGFTKEIQVPETTISAKSQVGIGGPKVPQTPKGMTDPVYVDGLDTDLKKGFYEQADLDTYYTGTSKTLDIGTGKITEGVTTGPLPENQVGIKTSDGMPKPKVGGKGYFGRAKDVYKKVAPIQAVGSEIQAGEDAEVFAKQQQQAYARDYFSSIGQNLLASGNSNPNVSVIDFNNPNPSDSDVYNLVNSYGGILGTS